ncbi:DUF58 domain-containing protein [Peribacillus kribbensis]|uniref:DUF58 domain-containing protein n=1 Tax=Peribacillus kribbensis TaxID=356658 RepID=UPI00047B0EF2|nr:DUF58 domain-containing protein [Peribacillus kribbensis]
MKQQPEIQTVYPFQAGFIAATVPITLSVIWLFPSPPILFILTCYYLYAAVLKLYNNRIMRSVEMCYESRSVRLFPGEETQIRVGIVNKGKFPVSQAKLNLSLDRNLILSEDQKTANDLNLISRYMILPQCKTVYWEGSVIPQKRGIYYMENVELILYDLFNSSSIHFPAIKRLKHEILVYPMFKPVAGVEELYKMAQGNSAAGYSLFRDELSISGIKAYEGEGFRQIHWKASARSGQMAAKRYQPVVQKGVTLCLYLTAEKAFYFHTHIEEFISYAAYLCRYFTERKMPYELFINLNGQNEPVHMYLNEGEEHFAGCLESLSLINEERRLLTKEYFNEYIQTKRASDNMTVWIGEKEGNLQKGSSKVVNKDGVIQEGEKRVLSIS